MSEALRVVSHRELRNTSGAVLRAVAAGESVVISNDGVPTALLTPIPTSDREVLVATGRLTPRRRSFTSLRLPPRRRADLDELRTWDRADER